MDNQILVIKEWEVGCERNLNHFRFAHLWVQIWNLPVHWMCRAVGFKLGKLFRSTREVIVPPRGERREAYEDNG